MNLFRSLLGVLILSFIIFSCKKERSSEDVKTPGIITEAWEFKETGRLFGGPIDSAYIQNGTVNRLGIVGTKTGDVNGEFFIQIVGENFEKGAYTNPAVFFQYSENGSVVFQSNPVESGSFTLTVTKIDSASISGTFSGTVQDAQGNKHIISDGKFSSSLTGTQSPPPVEKVKLTVWAKSICNDGGSIEVKVGGLTGRITDALSVEPTCDATGAATFTLPKADYTVEAICGTDTIRYDVSLSENCNTLEINFQDPPAIDDYLPLGLSSYWNYSDLANANVTQRITAMADNEVFDGRNYTRLESSLGDNFYFRKDLRVYYEYRTLDFQGAVDNPPSIEMVMLHEDYDAGQSWETPGVNIILSGVGVKIKLVSTIARRDYEDTFNGVNYTNLIEVDTEILFSSDGVNYQPSGNSYSIVFAKGIGIVYYFDLNRNTEWGIRDYFLNP